MSRPFYSLDKVLSIFWSKVKKTQTCWLWTGMTNRTKYPYGVYRRCYAHRFSWMLYFGKIPKKMCVCHKCDVRFCVNPKHLWLGTRKENNQDMWKKGRGKGKPPSGERNPNAKLTEIQVKQIRSLYIPKLKNSQQLADQFNVHLSTIHRIVFKRNWIALK